VTTRRSLLLPSLLAIVVILAGIPALRHGYHHYMTAIYPTDYQQEVETAASEFGVSPSLVFAVIHTESQFDAAAVSSAGAKGLMQLTNDTFQWALRRQATAEDSPKRICLTRWLTSGMGCMFSLC